MNKIYNLMMAVIVIGSIIVTVQSLNQFSKTMAFIGAQQAAATNLK